MARYIDADDLKAVIQANDWSNPVVPDVVCIIIDRSPSADVVPKSEEGAECPTCYGTGRIGTTNWLTKNMTKKQIAEEKAKAIAEHEQHIKADVAREIFEDLQGLLIMRIGVNQAIAELKKKYTEGGSNG